MLNTKRKKHENTNLLDNAANETDRFHYKLLYIYYNVGKNKSLSALKVHHIFIFIICKIYLSNRFENICLEFK